MSQCSGADEGQHRVEVHGPYVVCVCVICDAYVSRRKQMLAKACQGPLPEPGKSKAADERRRRRDRIRDDRHPKTGAPLDAEAILLQPRWASPRPMLDLPEIQGEAHRGQAGKDG